MNKTSMKRVRSWIVEEPWQIAVLSLMTVALGLILSEAEARIGWSILLVSVCTLSASILFIVWSVQRYNYSVVKDLSDEMNAKMEKYISADKIGWLHRTTELASLESKTIARDIWLLSSDLSEDSVGGLFQNVVLNNLKRGIRYRYFVPDTPEIRARVEQLKRLYKSTQNFTVTYLEADFFVICPEFDIVIHDPFKEKRDARMGFIDLPTGTTPRYCARTSEHFVDIIVGRLLPYVQHDLVQSVGTDRKRV